MTYIEEQLKKFKSRLDHAIEYNFEGGFKREFLIDFYTKSIEGMRRECLKSVPEEIDEKFFDGNNHNAFAHMKSGHYACRQQTIKNIKNI